MRPTPTGNKVFHERPRKPRTPEEKKQILETIQRVRQKFEERTSRIAQARMQASKRPKN